MGTIYNKPAVGPAWAETATNPGNIITMAPADVATGWPLTGIPPSRQRFNYLLNWCSAGVRYFMQRGLADYDAAETYSIGACIIGNDNGTYRSLVANNIGNTPSTSPAAWTAWALTLPQINASQLTQVTQGTGDNSSRVANTNFVQNAINALNAALTNVINNAIGVLNAGIVAAQNAANAAQGTANAASAAAGNAQNSANIAQNTAQAALNEIAALTLGVGVGAPGRGFNQTFQNTTGALMFVSGYAQTRGSNTGSLIAIIGASGPTNVAFANDNTASIDNGHCGFAFMVPAGWFYQVQITGAALTGGVGAWLETTLSV